MKQLSKSKIIKKLGITSHTHAIHEIDGQQVVFEDMELFDHPNRTGDEFDKLHSKIVAYVPSITNGELKRKVLGSMKYTVTLESNNDFSNLLFTGEESVKGKTPALALELIKYAEAIANTLMFTSRVDMIVKSDIDEAEFEKLGYTRNPETGVYQKSENLGEYTYENDYEKLYNQATNASESELSK